MKYLYLILIAFSLVFSSCSVSAFYVESGASIMSPTNPKEIKIYSGDIDQDFIVIGSIKIDTQGNAKIAKRYLQLRASKIGADATIH